MAGNKAQQWHSLYIYSDITAKDNTTSLKVVRQKMHRVITILPDLTNAEQNKKIHSLNLATIHSPFSNYYNN
jgi:hypothetical protein